MSSLHIEYSLQYYDIHFLLFLFPQYNQIFEIDLEADQKDLGKLVLDFDTETKEELVSVNEKLVKFLKPHQVSLFLVIMRNPNSVWLSMKNQVINSSSVAVKQI